MVTPPPSANRTVPGTPAPRIAAPERDGNRARRGLPVLAVKAALSLGLVAYLASTLDWASLSQALLAANQALVAAAFAVLALIPLLAAERWRSASIASGLALPRGFFLPATYASTFAGQFLPSGVGTDAVRLALLWRRDVPLRAGFQSIAIDRICGVSALVVLIWAGMPFVLRLLPPGTAGPVAAASALLVLAVAGLLMIDRLPLPPRWRRGAPGRLLSLVADARTAMATPRSGFTLLFGIVIHTLSAIAVLLLARAFGHDLRLHDLLTVTSIAIFAGMLPISFNGWGVREAALMVGLSLLAVPRDLALMLSFLYGIGGVLASLPGSVAWYRLRRAA